MEVELIQNTAAGFAEVNPILEDWQMGKESDTNKMKIGDGQSGWNDLKYLGGGGGYKMCDGMTFRQSRISEVPMVDMSELTTADYMFYMCNSLTKINVDLPNVVSAASFCRENKSFLQSAEINAPKLKDAQYMFYSCRSLSKVKINAQPTNASYLFQDCRVLTEWDVDTSCIDMAYYMFADCEAITAIDLDLPSATNIKNMFQACGALERVVLRNGLTTSLYGTFQYCPNLASIELIGFPAITDLYYAFSGCSNLKSVPLETSQVTTWGYTFYNSGIEDVEVDVSAAEQLPSTFAACSMLRKLKLISPKWKLYSGTLSNCSALESLTFDAQALSSGQSSASFLSGCTALVDLNISNLGKSSATVYNFSSATNWGVATAEYPDARQSLIDTLITNSYDRASVGRASASISLSSTTKGLLTEEEIAAITAKGFTIA